MKRFFLVLVALLISSIATQAQQAVDLDIIISEDSLTIYIPGPNPVSLNNFAFRYGSVDNPTIKAITSYPSFAGDLSQYPTPYCFRFLRDGANPSLPSSCAVATTGEQRLLETDVFWFRNGSYSPFNVLRNGESRGICTAGNLQCTIAYIVPPTPTPTTTSTVTPSPTLTPTQTFTPTNVPTQTPIPTNTVPPTLTPAISDTPVPTFTPTSTPTITPSPTATQSEEVPPPINPYNKIALSFVRDTGINDIEWSPDGKWLATGDDDGQVCIWSAENPAEITPNNCQQYEAEDKIWEVAWSPSGQRLATVGTDDEPWIWIVTPEGQLSFEIELDSRAHSGYINDVAWSPDGNYLVTAGSDSDPLNERFIIWSTFDWTFFDPIPITRPVGVAWSSDNTRVVSVEGTGVIRTVDARNPGNFEIGGRVIGERIGTGIDVDWDPIYESIVAIGTDGDLRLYVQPEEAEPCTNLDYALCDFESLAQNLEDPREVLFSPNGEAIAVASRGQVSIIRARLPFNLVQHYTLPQEFGVQSTVISTTWHPNNNYIAGVTSNGGIVIWNTTTEAPGRLTVSSTSSWQISSENVALTDLDWNSASSEIVITDRLGEINIWSADTEEIVARNRLSLDGRTLNTVTWNQTRGLIGTGDCSPAVDIWLVEDLRSNNMVPQVSLDQPDQHRECITDLEYRTGRDNDNILATADEIGLLRLWNLQDATQRQTPFDIRINDLAWNRTGNLIAIVNQNGKLGVYDQINIENPVYIRQPVFASMNAVEWSLNSDLLATASQNGWVGIWNLQSIASTTDYTGGYLLRGHRAGVRDISWSTPGDYLVSLTDDGQVIVWDALNAIRVAEINLSSGTTRLEWSPSGNLLALIDSSGQLSLYTFDPIE